MSEDTSSNRLTDEDRDRVLAWINDKWIHPITCEACGAHEWIVSDIIAALVQTTPTGNILLNGKQYPLIPVTCKNCGNTRSVNAIVLGLMRHPAVEAEGSR